MYMYINQAGSDLMTGAGEHQLFIWKDCHHSHQITTILLISDIFNGGQYMISEVFVMTS